MLELKNVDVNEKRVLVREDFNVPMEDDQITDDTRIIKALPTIEYLLRHNAAVIIISHLGRPTEGKFNPEFSLQPVADRLAELLAQPVKLISDWQKNGMEVEPGDVVMLENVRFNIGEKNCDEKLSRAYASLCDIFVMDAFATAHRSEASTTGVIKLVKIACAGFLLSEELKAFKSALDKPVRPLMAIVGGAKVSTKLAVLIHLLDKVNQLITGGGIANTLLLAQGYKVGKSLVENNMLDEARKLIQAAKQKNVEILLPVDVIVAKTFSADAKPTQKNLDQVTDDDLILDIGEKTQEIYRQKLLDAGTIVWNGPVGVFEFDAFSHGTQAIGEAIAESKAYSLAGGGDTIAAINKFDLSNGISYISTAGGAFLEWLEGKPLPAIAALEKKAA